MIPCYLRRIFIARHRIDFRRRFDGLLADAYRLGANPYEGDCVAFLNGDHTQLRAILGDKLGLYLLCRRFEGGRLRANFKFVQDPSADTISSAELSLLFEGASFTVHKRVPHWQ